MDESPAIGVDAIRTVADVVDALGGPTEFGRICGYARNPSARGSDIRQRGSIPVRYWGFVVGAARAKGLAIDEVFLTRLHGQKAAPDATPCAEPAA